jgi:hypothetical protein
MKKLFCTAYLLAILFSPFWVSISQADPLPNETEVGHLQSYMNPNNRDSIYLDLDVMSQMFPTQEQNTDFSLYAGLVVGGLFVYSIITAIG